MSLFPDGMAAEERLCMKLKAAVEEFGAENVRLEMPTAWREWAETDYLGQVRMDFVTEDCINICADSFGWRAQEPLLPGV